MTSWIQALVTLGALSALGASFARVPSFFARFAFVPVGKPVTLPIPPQAAAALMARQAGAGTYRSMGPTKARLSQLPGDPDVNVGEHRLRFHPERGWVSSAKPSWRKPALVRVDVQSVDGAFVLRAKELPDAIVWLPAIVLFLWLRWGSSSLASVPIALIGAAIGLIMSFLQRREDAGRCFGAVVDEMKKRIDALSAGG